MIKAQNSYNLNYKKIDREKEIDEYIQADYLKKIKEEDERWKQAEEKRFNLLKETYESRKNQLLNKSNDAFLRLLLYLI